MKRRAAFGEVRAFAEALFFICILVDAAPRANARALADAPPAPGGGRFAARMGFLDRILAAGTARSRESNDGDGGIEETCRRLDPFYGCSIDTIIVRDNRHTKPASILREMATKQGDCLDERFVRRDAAYLRGLGYFTKVDMSAEQATPGACRLVVSVVDRPGLFMRFPYPVVNYDFEKGISYGFAWKLKNFRGNAEDLSLSAVRRQDEEEGAGFSWSNPWFTGRRIRLGLDMGAYRRIEEPFDEDEDYIRERVSAGVGVGIPLSKSIVRQLRISPTVAYEARISRRTLPDGAGNLETAYYRQNFISAGGEIEFDSRSDHISPFDGVVARLRMRRYSSIYGLDEKYILYGTANYFYIPVGAERSFIVAIRSDVREGDLPAFLDMRLGGSRDVRGYAEENERGQAKLGGTLQYRARFIGPRILRTETAGPAALAALGACCGDI